MRQTKPPAWHMVAPGRRMAEGQQPAGSQRPGQERLSPACATEIRK